jgi:cysteine desulfurase
MGIDLLSLSGHKVYGPKGIGALYVRHRPRVRLTPLFSGGGQERGFRSGTLAPFLCVGLGEAAAICACEMADDASRIAMLAQRLMTALERRTIEVRLNGHPTRRLVSSLNLQFPGTSAVDLLARLPDLAASTGSACNSAEIEPSYVLKQLGLNREQAGSSVRFSLGRFTTEAEIDRAAVMIADALRFRHPAPILAEDMVK